MNLDSGKWLDTNDELFLKQLQNAKKTFHQLYLAFYPPILHYGIHSHGGPPKAAPHCLLNGGCRNKWLDNVDETLLKHVAIISKTFNFLDPAIYHCLDLSSFLMCLPARFGL